MDTPATDTRRLGVLVPELLDDLLPFLGESVCLYDAHGRLKARLGPPDGVLGLGETIGANVFANLHPDDLPRAIQLSEAVLASTPGWQGTYRLRLAHRDGDHRPCEVRVVNRLGDPRLDGVVLCIREIVPEVEAEPLGSVTEPSVGSMADALPVPYLLVGNRGNIRYVNRAASTLLATHRDDLFGTPLVDVVVDEDRAGLLAAIDDVLGAPGRRTAVAQTAPVHGDRLLELDLHSEGTMGRTSMIAVVLVDRSAETELVRRATHDALTGVANRTTLADTVTGMLLEMGTGVSVVYVDLDRFKDLNDEHGHAYGDRVLVAVADRLRTRTRPEDLVARMSGDEFVVVCPRISPEDLDGLLVRLGRPIWVDDDQHGGQVLLSVGAATAQPGDTAADLLHRADVAMYAAKRARRQALGGAGG